MLSIIKPALMSMLLPHVYLIFYLRPPCNISVSEVIFQILPSCSRLIMLPHVIFHVTAVSHAFFIVQGDLKKRKYKIRGIKEK